MDLVALSAVVGLAFIGKQISDTHPPPPIPEHKPVEKDPRLRGLPYGKEEVHSFRDISANATRSTYGQPVYNMSSRENVTNVMKNLSSSPWNRVGPGLGVGSNVPATGGYQQYIREIPINPNEEHLHQLPGRIQAPPTAPVPRQPNATEVAKNRPDQVYYRETKPGSGILRGPESRAEYVKGSRSTLKDQTIGREVELLGAPLVITNNPFNSGYVVTGNQSLDRKNARERPDRAGNPGRMNVRSGPLGAHGMVSRMKSDTMSTREGLGGSLISQGYSRTAIQEVNQFKDIEDDRDLDIAKKQLADNVYNHSFTQ